MAERLKDPIYALHQARQQRIDYITDVLSKRKEYAQTTLEHVRTPEGVRQHLEAVFGSMPDLEKELKSLEKDSLVRNIQ